MAQPHAATQAPYARLVLASTSYHDHVAAVQPVDSSYSSTTPHRVFPGAPTRCDMNPAGTLVALACLNRNVYITDLDLNVKHTITLPSFVVSVRFHR
jgi:hypothetical protein